MSFHKLMASLKVVLQSAPPLADHSDQVDGMAPFPRRQPFRPLSPLNQIAFFQPPRYQRLYDGLPRVALVALVAEWPGSLDRRVRTQLHVLHGLYRRSGRVHSLRKRIVRTWRSGLAIVRSTAVS